VGKAHNVHQRVEAGKVKKPRKKQKSKTSNICIIKSMLLKIEEIIYIQISPPSRQTMAARPASNLSIGKFCVAWKIRRERGGKREKQHKKVDINTQF
jgi:hypothetical protein